MILFSAYLLDDIPFSTVYIHGILRAKDGRKFSKSLGNGIDPLEVMEQYGTDALRFSLIKGISPGNDARFYEEKVEDARNFVNKLWNVTRFVLGQSETTTPTELSVADQWITAKLNRLVSDVTEHLAAYEFSPAAEKLYAFVWRDFADWYVEVTKFQPNPQLTRSILETILTLAHPFIPFVTEVLWKEMGHTDLLMIAQWSNPTVATVSDEAQQHFASLQEFIIHIRALRAQYKIAPSIRIELSQFTGSAEEQLIVEKLARVTLVDTVGGIPIQASGRSGNLHIEKVIDVAAEKIRIAKDIAETTKHLHSAEVKLQNEKFIANAPADVVAGIRAAQADHTEKLQHLQAALEMLG
jgi:valyl-tRNA synthetase